MHNKVINNPLCEYPTDYQFNGIDLIKFICSFLVCMVHIQPIQGISSFWVDSVNYLLRNCLGRIAVPFFFAASAFLLFRKMELYSIDKNRIKMHCFKLLQLLGIWSTLLILGYKDHLWYLSGLVIATILFSVLFRKTNSFVVVFAVAGLLYFVGVFGDSYAGVAEKAFIQIGFDSYREVLSLVYTVDTRAMYLGLFSALIFFSLGVFLVYKPIRIHLLLSAIAFFLSLGLVIIEAYIIRHYTNANDYNMYFSLIPTTFFLLYIATHIKLKNRSIYKKLRAVGVLVYFLHIAVYAVVKNALGFINTKLGIDLSCFTFILVIIIVTCFAVVIEKLSNKEKTRWLRYLYS